MIPRLNGLYKYKHEDIYLRVLYVDSHARLYYACQVNEVGDMLEWPVDHRTFEEFSVEFKNLEVHFKEEFLPKAIQLSPKATEKQERLYTVIKEIVDNNEPEIYFPGMRNQIITKWRENNNNEYGVSTLYGHIERYLARGRFKAIFSTNYHKCGNPGVDKPIGKVKKGRPRFKDTETELILTESDIKIIQDSFKKYVDLTKTNAVSQGYDLMITEHYLRKKKYPSKSQFITYGEKILSASDRKKLKLGPIIYNKDHKPSKGPLNGNLEGPGSNFIVDATKDNTRMVSVKFYHKYYGRCTLYLVVDGFSGMIPGFVCTPDNASYNTWKLAMYHCGIPKGEWLKSIGLDGYTDDDWPCKHMPHRFITDRAPEHISYKSESLPNNLEITLTNVQAYSPHQKGIIEKAIGDLLFNLVPLLSGAGLVTGGEERITNDSRKDAYLSYLEMTQIIAVEIMYHNNHHVMKDFQRTPEMIEDNIPCIPREIWNWAMAKGLGSLRVFDKEDLWRKLMEYAHVSFNKEGYLFEGQRWINTDEEGELLRANLVAKRKTGDKVTISFNPHSIKETYLFHDNKFYSLRPYENLNFETLFDLSQEEKKKDDINSVFETKAVQHKAEKIEKQQKIIKKRKNTVLQQTGTIKPILNQGRETKKEEISEFNENFQRGPNNSSADESEHIPESSSPKVSLIKLDRTDRLKNIRNEKNG